MKTRWSSSLFFMFLLFAVFFLITGCPGEKSGQADEADEGLIQPYIGPSWSTVAMLETGDHPLWFELGPDGPALIASPDASTLIPYVPWPHARYAAGIQAWNGYIVMAINRNGFIILGSTKDILKGMHDPERDTEAIMYRVTDNGFWDSYTVESFFIWDDMPAVLLYRNDFFAESSAPPPLPQVHVLDRASPFPLGVNIPAFENVPPGDFWETEVVRQGPDGFWYYRMREKGKAQNSTAYFRAQDLSGDAERVGVGEWRNSDSPGEPELISPHLADVLFMAASILDIEGNPAVRIISPNFDIQRFVWTVPASPENIVQLYGFCSETDQIALAILGDGRGLCSYGEEPRVRPFSLPALPEGFVYTGIALLNDVLLATWEEQEEAGIGAAGFLTMAAEWRH